MIIGKVLNSQFPTETIVGKTKFGDMASKGHDLKIF